MNFPLFVFLFKSVVGESMHGKHSFWLIFFEIILLIIAFFTAIFLIMAGTEQYWRKPDVEVKMQNNSEIDPNDSVILSFSQPVKTALVEKDLKINPETRVEIKWLDEDKKLEIKPSSYFEPGREYSLEFSVPKGLFGYKKETKNLNFQIHDFPQVMEAVPGKESQNISIDSDFKISFDHSVHDFNVNFEISPGTGFQWEGDDEKKSFRIFPQDKLAYETVYIMKITAQPVSSGAPAPVQEIFSGVFQTEKKPAPAATRSNSAIIPEDQVVDNTARVADGKYIDINLAKQQLSIFEKGNRLGTYRISTGKRGMATPTGNFKILAKRGKAWSHKYKLFMPYFMQFTGVGHGIHELPEWPGGYKEGAAHLGIPVSHGCVRLGIGPAAKVYAWADIGTPVVIHY